MKRLTNSMATAAAVLMVTAGVASAQQSLLKAEVPFAFSVGNKVMEPGTIWLGLVDSRTGSGPITVNNSATQRTYVVLPKSESDAPRRWIERGQAKLTFDCTSGACILIRAWTGTGRVYKFYGPKTRSGEVQLTEIATKPDRAN